MWSLEPKARTGTRRRNKPGTERGGPAEGGRSAADAHSREGGEQWLGPQSLPTSALSLCPPSLPFQECGGMEASALGLSESVHNHPGRISPTPPRLSSCSHRFVRLEGEGEGRKLMTRVWLYMCSPSSWRLRLSTRPASLHTQPQNE